MKPKQIKKLYYSISEVSKLTSLKQYVLRYWETEFSELRPSKNRAGNRIYRLSDIKLLFLIKKSPFSKQTFQICVQICVISEYQYVFLCN